MAHRPGTHSTRPTVDYNEDADQDLVVVADDTAREAGFIAPVMISRLVWDDCVAWTHADHARTGALQDESGRLWDVLYMASRAVRALQQRHGDGWTEAVFQVWRVARDARPGEDGDIEPTPVYLTAALTGDGVTITGAES
jgi:hypothetical protein